MHWPFPPGYFIGILGFLAAIVTFLERPKWWLKVPCTVLFFGLMWCEIWMVGKDRDAREKGEKDSRNEAQQQTNSIDFLMVQNVAANTHLSDLDREMAAAKGNPQLVAELNAQVVTAQREANTASAKFIAAMLPGIIQDSKSIDQDWMSERTHQGYLLRAASEWGPGQPPVDIDAAQLQHQRNIDAMNIAYTSRIQPTIRVASALQNQLLKLIPTGETWDDRYSANLFEKVLSGNTITEQDFQHVVMYLQTLADRVAPVESN